MQVLLNVLVHPLDHRTRSLFRSTVCPFLPEGMDLVFITSQQVAANYSVALAAENATFGDMVFVDAERDHAEHGACALRHAIGNKL